MKAIRESEIDFSKLYLFYTSSPDCKELMILRILGGKVSVVQSVGSSRDLHNNRSTFTRTDSRAIQDIGDIKFFRSLYINTTALFELTDDEANLILAQII